MIIDDIKAYRPCCEQERRDKQLILDFIEKNDDAFLRTNLIAHMTASAWVVNPPRAKVLMVYHNIYDSWSWTGGHADGETDLLAVALREVQEETGVRHLRPVSRDIFSLEALTVDGHEKRGEYVPSHLHLNVTYLIEASEADTLHVCAGENSGVRWFTPEEALLASSEPWFVERIYKRYWRPSSAASRQSPSRRYPCAISPPRPECRMRSFSITSRIRTSLSSATSSTRRIT